MSKLRVLIVGASIAGPTAAYWFAKAGASVTVIERFPRLRTNGHNVDIRTSGVTVMRRMSGMESTVRAKTINLDGLCLVREDGRLYGTIKASGNPDQQTLLSEYEIYRGDLAQILFDATKDNKNIEYVFDEQISSIHKNDEIDESIHVEFANHLPTTKYDLVVACDGVTSRTRAIGFNCGVRDHMYSTNCWAAFFSTKKDHLGGSRMGHAHSSLPGRFMSVEHNPYGGNIVQMMALHPLDGADATAPLREAMKQGDEGLKRQIANHYAGHGWLTDEVLRDMMQAEDLYASEIARVKVPSLYKGRVVLVGDAGYAPGFTGTGTTLALTGAYVVAGEILKHQGNIRAGLEGYERTMRPIITEMSKTPPLVPTIMAPQTAWALWLRNTIFTLIAWSKLLEYAQRLLGSFAGKITDYPLPEYDWLE